jgi:hypothetical protein
MKRIFLVLLFALAGCGQPLVPADKALSACMTKTSPPQALGDVSDHDRRYLIVCMGKKGFDFDNLLADCNRQFAPTTLVRCYKSRR